MGWGKPRANRNGFRFRFVEKHYKQTPGLRRAPFQPAAPPYFMLK
jgi:hypothetical protein